MRAIEVAIKDLPKQVAFGLFEVPPREGLRIYHSLLVLPGEQSNLPYPYVSLAYTGLVHGKRGNLWVAQCDQPLWEGDLIWQSIGEFRVNDYSDDGVGISRLKFRRDSTYLHMESSAATIEELTQEAEELQPIPIN